MEVPGEPEARCHGSEDYMAWAVLVRSLLEDIATKPRLPDDAGERANRQRFVVRDRNSCGRSLFRLLHDHVTASPPHFLKAVGTENSTDLLSR